MNRLLSSGRALMSQERISMRKLKEVYRLHFECNLSNRKIALALKLSATTIGHYVKAAKDSGLSYQSLCEMNEHELCTLVEKFSHKLKAVSAGSAIDFASVHAELRQKGVTRQLLYQEYQQALAANQKAISYSEFCRQYRQFKKVLKPSMRQTHIAGEKTFVDYAGPTVPIYDDKTGEINNAVIFVGVLGASNYTFANATLTRSLPDWIGVHQKMFEFYGGVTEIVVPDNEKSAVTKACHYDPDLNPNYAALAAHYGTAIIPARPYKPKDKAKAEVGVQIVERWILARLRHHKFFSLVELNDAISTLLVDLNNKPFKKLEGSRQSLFEKLDKPALKPLPSIHYEYKTIKKAQVSLDYHVEIDNHYYSVPHQKIGKTIEYHLTQQLVSIFHQGERIAEHIRSFNKGKSTTINEHMPKAHLQHQQWTPIEFKSWSKEVGPQCAKVADYLIKHRSNPEWCYRIHLGFLNLAKKYGKARLEQACLYANNHHLYSFNHIKSILQTQCDKAPINSANENYEELQPCEHTNIRGPQYYLTKTGDPTNETTH